MGLSGTKGNDTPRTIEGRVRADILAPHKSVPSVNSSGFHPKRVSIPLDSTPGSHTHPLTKGTGAARAAELRSFRSSFYPLPLCSSRSRALGVIPSWHGIFHAKPDRSLLSNSACALLPGQRAQRSLHPATELSFSMSCLPRTRNLIAQAGRAHAAMLLTVF